MKLLTKNTDYAVRALLELTRQKGAFISARQVAKEQDIPYQYLRRILRELIKNGLVISREGSRGGFKINKKPDSIAVVDVVKLFQGDIQFSECMFRNKICANRSKCVLRKEVQRIEKIVKKEFKGITIARLLKSNIKL
ncbi:MAG: Rrf2 family transcriptional regulator [Candidatus Omnitrophota bacterium]